jgi:uncharacterized protein (TIGR03435 family)
MRCVALIALFAAGTLAQVAPRLEFETVTVKVHPIPPGRFMIKNFTHAPPFVIPTSNKFIDTVHTQDLVMEAYGLSEYQILYLPGWALSRDGYVYDIEAKAKGDATPTPDQLQQMLQSLLADRFHLKAHFETKAKFSVNALVIDKDGPKFHPFQNDGPAGAFAGTTIFALARFLTPNVDFPVVDRTGLPAGTVYDFNLDKMVDFHEVDREQGADPLAAQDYLRTAVQHQLGLRMEPRKESTQILSIDHIEEPPTK